MNERDALLRTVQRLIEAISDERLGPDDALELDSFTLVEVLEAIERAVGVTIRPQDLRPEHFQSARTVAALVHERQQQERT